MKKIELKIDWKFDALAIVRGESVKIQFVTSEIPKPSKENSNSKPKPPTIQEAIIRVTENGLPQIFSDVIKVVPMSFYEPLKSEMVVASADTGKICLEKKK